MSTDPEILPPETVFSPAPPEAPVKSARHIPNLGDTLLFLVITGILLILTEIATFAVAIGLHIFGRETPQQLLLEPRLLIPTMAISYLAASVIVWAIFTNLWRTPFSFALRWNFAVVRRRLYSLLAIGIVLSVSVQLLSNYLPIPKTLPIDDFFRTPADVWLVAIFGTFMAPVFEELAFRGFLLPSLATAWDWMRRRKNPPGASDPSWSAGALVVSCTLTSIAFALVHADQLAHAWAPLAVLFAVSMVLCLVRLWSHSFAASALVHATYNGTIFALVFYATDGFRHLDKLNR